MEQTFEPIDCCKKYWEKHNSRQFFEYGFFEFNIIRAEN